MRSDEQNAYSANSRGCEMRNLAKIIRCIAVTAAFLLALALPVFAYADEGVPDTADTPSSAEQMSPTPGSATDASNASDAPSAPASDAAINLEGGAGSDVRVIDEGQSPLSPQPYEQGWSLVNLLLSLLTVIIGVTLVGFSMLQRQRGSHVPSNFGLTVFSMASAVISTILFTSTEDVQTQMIAIDNFTIIHITILGVSLLCAFLFLRKDLRKDSEDPSFH
jgi:hypothetical protein